MTIQIDLSTTPDSELVLQLLKRLNVAFLQPEAKPATDKRTRSVKPKRAALFSTTKNAATRRRPANLELGDKSLDPEALFGIWKDAPRDLQALRAKSWQRNWTMA